MRERFALIALSGVKHFRRDCFIRKISDVFRVGLGAENESFRVSGLEEKARSAEDSRFEAAETGEKEG